MGSEVRVIQTPGSDVDYWLCRCEGFQVETPEEMVGVVEWLVFRSRHDRPDALVVRTGHILHRSVVIPVKDVEHVLPEEGRIILVANPVPVARVRTLTRRPLPGTATGYVVGP